MTQITDPLRLRATFADESDVHDAALALEKHGVDASDISLSEPDHLESTARIDTTVAGWMSRRFLLGGLAVAAVVGLVALGIAALLGARMGVALMVGGSAAIFGFWLGGYYGVATKLPFNTGTLEAVADKRSGPYWVEVRAAAAADEDDLRELFDAHGAHNIERAPHV